MSKKIRIALFAVVAATGTSLVVTHEARAAETHHLIYDITDQVFRCLGSAIDCVVNDT